MALMVSARATNGSCRAEVEGDEPESPAPRPTTHELFQAHGSFVLRLVRRLGGAPPEVEDIAQEVFLQVHNTLPRMDPRVPPRSWLFGIVRRVVANHRRKTRRRNDFLAEIEHRERAREASAAPHGWRERWLLDQALDRLDADKREVFVLFELEGLPMKEVAQLVGCLLATAYSRLHAARSIVQHFVLSQSDAGDTP
jgi:RNA polymerase sigma-70 factor (ECF subfamily)